MKWLFRPLAILAFVLIAAHPTYAWDVSSYVEVIGNPSRARWQDANNGCRYARNVWDLQSFNNKLYIGAGNSANQAPCQNAGPVNVATYRPDTNQFVNEFVVNDEQIDKFRIVNGELTIPGHDPKDDQTLGNWYRLENGTWIKHRNIPNGIHNYDILSFQGKLFAAVGAFGSSVYISSDNGATFTQTDMPIGWRSYELFTLNNKLYATHTYGGTYDLGLHEYKNNSSFQAFAPLTFTKLFPGVTKSSAEIAMFRRTLNYKGAIVYIGAWNIFDHQWNPFGLFKATSITPTSIDAVSQSLPGNAKPWDLLIGADGNLYALGTIQNGNRFWVTVSSTSDFASWRELYRFDAPTFARSFEQLNGDWYFGLGTDTTTLSISSGDILRLKPTSLGFRPGDINQDKKVNIQDYVQLFEQYGETGIVPADINQDQAVNILDYTLLFENYGL